MAGVEADCDAVLPPRVTIITATYNAGDALERTAKSMRGLTSPAVEWVIIDGGSEDDTIGVIRRHADLVAHWESVPDKGIYDAWNAGVARARGEWIGFLGAGDAYHPDALARYLHAVDSAPAPVNFVSSRVRHVDAGGGVRRIWGGPLEQARFRRYLPIAQCGSLHHRSLFEQFGRFDLSYTSAADYEFLWRCLPGLRPLFVDAITTDMVVGGISAGYVGLFETYRIQRRYGVGASALPWLWLALAKRTVRPLVRGY